MSQDYHLKPGRQAPPRGVSAPTQMPDRRPDNNDLGLLEKQLVESVDKLMAMTDDVGKSRHILEYDSERRKRALAIAVGPLLGQTSSVAAESHARCSPSHQQALDELGKEYRLACTVMAEWDALKTKIEVTRSLLSMEKAKVGLM